MSRKSEFPLHYAAFKNDVKSMSKNLREGAFVDAKDIHGNTPLHIAIMLGHKESISLLLSHNAPIKTKNAQGWNCLMEALSYGDRQIITSVLRKLKSQSRDTMTSRKPHLLAVLEKLNDFYLELKWDFHSWLPLVSRILPSDVCKVWKLGTSLRLDTTLVDFNDRTWERGDISFVFDSTAEKPDDSLVIFDNKAKVFQRVKYEESEVELEEEVDVLMSSDIVNVQMSTKPITFNRAFSGWFFKHERTEQVGEYTSDYYTIDGMTLESKKRREHLSADDVKKNKSLVQNLQRGTIADDDLKNSANRKSLPPPPRPVITWDQYISCPASFHPNLGRPPILKESIKNFKATVAMSEQFPLSVEVLLNILEIVAPFKHLNKLRKFCEVRLPPGFPVRIEIPLLPTISAKVTFQKMEFRNDLDVKMFQIPKTYREDSNRFPDL